MTKIMLCETHYDKNASKELVKSGWFTEEEADEIIQDLYNDKIHAFVYAPNYLVKYLVGIARMAVAESTDHDTCKQFIYDNVDTFNEYLMWVREHRDEYGASLDSEFMKTISYQELLRILKDIDEQKTQAEKDALASADFDGGSNYEVVPIKSYEQMHDEYGGHWTGDGSSDRYAGGGGTAWCHTNNKSVYNNYTSHGKDKFFILQRKDWKDIPFNAETNREMHGKDEYGNSLLAIVVNKYGKLKYCTLRSNHVGNPKGNADLQYKDFAELSQLANMNVQEEILKNCSTFAEGDIPYLFEDGIFKGFDPDFDKRDLQNFTIPEGCTEIRGNAFGGCENLDSIVIPNTVTSIRAYAFINCYSLTSITIPESVTKIGKSAFANCRGLTSVALPEGLTELGTGVFKNCYHLTSVNIPEGLTYLHPYVFYGCSGLTSIEIPNGVDTIGEHAFSSCSGLTSIEIPSSVKYIKESAFSSCTELTSVVIPETVRRVEDSAFYYCQKLTDVVYNPETTEVSETAFNYTPYAKAKTEGVKKESTKIRRAKKGKYHNLHEMLKTINN